MRRLLLSLTAACLAAIFLVGCGTSPPARYFHLQPMVLEAGQAEETKRLGVGPLHFPQYLDRPQIVTLVDAAQMSIDDYSLWAEPLDEAVPRIIAVNLSGLTESIAAVDHRHYNFLPFEYRLVGNVLQFHADAEGRVQLAVVAAGRGGQQPDAAHHRPLSGPDR